MQPKYLSRLALDEALRRHLQGTAEPCVPSLPDALYKFVDSKHADLVASGSIRLGNPAIYAMLDNGRADDMDGTVVVRPAPLSLKKGEGAEHRRGMAQFGQHCFGEVEINGSVEYRLADPSSIMLCFSDRVNAPSLVSPTQAIFRVRNVEAYARRLLNKFGLNGLRVGSI